MAWRCVEATRAIHVCLGCAEAWCLGGATQSLYIRVADADAHHVRAAQAGRIIEE